MRGSSWFGRQRQRFGLPFLSCICVVYFAQGFRSLAGLATQTFLKEQLRLEPAAMQNLLTLSALPWSFKPLYGLCSDAFSILGQHRKPYLVLGALIGVVAWCGLAAIAAQAAAPMATAPLPPVRSILLMLTLSNLSTALSDVIVDAMVAERCSALARAEASAVGEPNQMPSPPGGAAAESGGAQAAEGGTEGENALQSLCWGSLAVGGLVGSGLGSLAASTTPVSVVFLMSASCPALVLAASHALVDGPSAAAPSLAGEAHAGSDAPPSSSSLAAVRRQLAALADALATPAIYKPLLFFWLQNALVPSVSQPWFFFQTDALGFSAEFLAAQGVLAFAFLLVGSLVYSRYVQGVGFLRIFYAGQCLSAICSISSVVLVARLNVRLGVPDTVFLLGSDAIDTVVNRVMMQPFFVIAARLCPVGCEAALYSAFMSIYNLGNACSGWYGALLTQSFGVEKGHYDGLLSLMLLRSVSMLLPLLLIHPLLAGIQHMKTE